MGDKSIHCLGLVCRKSLFLLFTSATLLFFLSWFFLLGSTSAPRLIDNNLLLANSNRMFSVSDDPKVIPRCHEYVSSQEREDTNTNTCDPKYAMLKVFMYDLPAEFHFGLLDWAPEADSKSVWPDITKKIPSYPGGLNLQHSIEYWLALDLLSSRFPNRPGPCTAVRIFDSKEADVVFVPFFSSLCYNRNTKKRHEKGNRNKVLQDKLVKFLTEQEEWKRYGGRDHIIMAHHPNSLLDARMKLWNSMFILSDFGRYPPHVANVDKDIIAPYKHMIRSYENDSAGFDDRPTLLYFQGAIYRKDGGYIRQELFYLLKDEKDVHFSFGSIQKNGISQASQGMHSSKFCFNIAGDTPSSNRLFDAIASHCVPVIVSDEIELPYEDVLDYSKFCVFVRAADATKENYLINLIRGISREQWTQMWERLKEVQGYFEYRYPSQKDDAVQMIWQTVARKIPLLKLKLHRLKRFARFEGGLNPRRFSRFNVGY